jgi:hypothetical protein
VGPIPHGEHILC